MACLVKNGATLTTLNANRQTPLQKAFHYHNLFALHLLLDKKPDFTNKLWDGSELFKYLVETGDYDSKGKKIIGTLFFFHGSHAQLD